MVETQNQQAMVEELFKEEQLDGTSIQYIQGGTGDVSKGYEFLKGDTTGLTNFLYKDTKDKLLVI